MSPMFEAQRMRRVMDALANKDSQNIAVVLVGAWLLMIHSRDLVTLLRQTTEKSLVAQPAAHLGKTAGIRVRLPNAENIEPSMSHAALLLCRDSRWAGGAETKVSQL